MNAGTIIVETLGSAGGAAGVGGFFLAVWVRGSTKRQEAAALRRTVEAAKTKTVIESAIRAANAPLIKRFDENDELTRATVTRVDRLEQSQFGPNGGGLRQAVNDLTDMVHETRERVVAVETKLDMPAPQRRARSVKVV